MNPNKRNRRHNSPKTPSRSGSAVSLPASLKASGSRAWLGLVLAGSVLAIAAFFYWVRPNRQTGVAGGPLTGSGALSVNSAAANPGGTNASSLASTDHAGHEGGESAASDAEIAVGLLTRGNELLAEGKIEEAVKEYEHSLRHDAGSEDTHYNLAIALAKLGKDDVAIQHYKEALRILPDYAEAHNNLGNLLVKLRQYEEAIQHFDEALKLNPDSASTHNNLGKAQAITGKITDATIHFAKAVQLSPDYVDAHCNLGTAYAAQGRVDEAIEEFREALRLQPDFAPAQRALAKVMQKKSP